MAELEADFQELIAILHQARDAVRDELELRRAQDPDDEALLRLLTSVRSFADQAQSLFIMMTDSGADEASTMEVNDLVLAGLALGAALGSASAILLAASPFARAVLHPMLVISQAVPVFALAPILTLWLGYGLWPKVAMALLIVYFPVTSAFFDALMRTPAEWRDLARVMGARPSLVMGRLRIPAALPGFASGLRLAAVYAPIGAIIGEWVGASQGLSYLMLLANGRAKIDLMFAALIVLVLLTLGLHAVMDAVCRWRLRHRGA